MQIKLWVVDVSQIALTLKLGISLEGRVQSKAIQYSQSVADSLQESRIMARCDMQGKLKAANTECQQLQSKVKSSDQHLKTMEHKWQTNLLAEQRQVCKPSGHH